jgi:hypothetical protein
MNVLKSLVKGLISGLLMVVVVHVSYCTAVALVQLPTLAHIMMITELVVFIFVVLIYLVIGIHK